MYKKTRQSLTLAVMETLGEPFGEDVVIYICLVLNSGNSFLPEMLIFKSLLFLRKIKVSSSVRWFASQCKITSSSWFRATVTLQLWGSWVCSNPTRMFQQIYMSLVTDKHVHYCHRCLTVTGPGSLAVEMLSSPRCVADYLRCSDISEAAHSCSW